MSYIRMKIPMSLLLCPWLMFVLVTTTKSATAAETPRKDSNDESPDAAAVKKAALFVDGVWDSIERIRSGDVRIHEIAESRQGTHEVDYRYAFDTERDFLRYDFDSSGQFIQYARNESELLLHNQMSNKPRGISRFPRDYAVKVYNARPYDFLTAPLAPFGAFHIKMNNGDLRDLTYNVMASRLVGWNETATLIEMTWEFDVKRDTTLRGQRLLVLDREQGTMPTLLEESNGPRDSQVLTVYSRTETTWANVADVWIPQSCRLSAPLNGRVRHLTYEWERVNTTLSKRVFELGGFEPPDGTLVMNHKLGGSPVLEERIGETPMLKGTLPVRSSSGKLRAWIIAINLVVIALAGILWAVRSRMKR